jgi:hypothetical protein
VSWGRAVGLCIDERVCYEIQDILKKLKEDAYHDPKISS